MGAATAESRWWKYAIALPLMLFALAIGNLLGLVMASTAGWENLDLDRPGGVALAALQGLVGSFLAVYSGHQLFKTHEPILFWLKAFVSFAAVLLCVLIILALAKDRLGELMTWKTASGIAGIFGTEAGRRIWVKEMDQN